MQAGKIRLNTNDRNTMIEAKDLDKHPVRYGTQYLAKLLEESKAELIEELTFTVREGNLLVTCKDDQAYQILKKCESKLDKNFITKLGLESFVFQYDKYYLVLRIINEFAKQGVTEFTIQAVLDEVNKYDPPRTPQAIKEVLAFLAYDFSKSGHRVSYYSEHLMQLRGLCPLVKRQKTTYALLLKVKTKSASSKKAKGK